MNRTYRKTIIAGNWKMNKTPEEAKTLIRELKEKTTGEAFCEIVLCTPFLDIPAAVSETKETALKVGAENMYFEDKGAFTGEISADMLLNAGVTYVILGHSERRGIFGETDELIRKKVEKALQKGLTPILCVGESLEQRDRGVTLEHICMQVKLALSGLTGEDAKKVVLAYEPIWAIGTGRTATAQQAQEVNGAIRNCLTGLFGEEVARSITILYGGSMNAKNASELLSMPDIDGGLIGGASLTAEDFAQIIAAANQ